MKTDVFILELVKKMHRSGKSILCQVFYSCFNHHLEAGDLILGNVLQLPGIIGCELIMCKEAVEDQ